ncbi:MAG: sulfite exporter TauE/SafE family protein [Magnetococcales bacterium]|nr:sulfite exporter TauE/SafE family protein [Magnetococcales bacterium]
MATEGVPDLLPAATVLLGLTMGMTACAAYCLPYFGAWILGNGERGAWGNAGWFLAGRVTAYAGAGGVAAALGGVVKGGAGHLPLAGVSLLLGVLLLRAPQVHDGGCGMRERRAWPPWLLGAALGLVPCPTLAGLLAACALSGDVGVGVWHGLLFGVSATLAPVLLVVGVVGRTGGALREIFPTLAPWLRRGAGVALIALALARVA